MRERIHCRVVLVPVVVVVVVVGGGIKGGLSLSLSGETRASHRRYTLVHVRGSRVTLVCRDFIVHII